MGNGVAPHTESAYRANLLTFSSAPLQFYGAPTILKAIYLLLPLNPSGIWMQAFNHTAPYPPLYLKGWQRGRAMVGLELQVGFTLQDKQFIGISNWLGGGYGIERISAARVGQLYIKGYRSHFIHIPCP